VVFAVVPPAAIRSTRYEPTNRPVSPTGRFNFGILTPDPQPRRREPSVARTVMVTDDLDGSSPAEEVQFTYDGVTWSIDLSEDNRKRLHDALEPFLSKAHPAHVAAPSVETPTRTRRASKPKEDGEKIDYATPEHAGFPHRGRVSPEEAAYVREHFDDVQKRLSDAGVRMLDPSDPKIRERYGLTSE
jgi:hypothetical protein